MKTAKPDYLAITIFIITLLAIPLGIMFWLIYNPSEPPEPVNDVVAATETATDPHNRLPHDVRSMASIPGKRCPAFFEGSEITECGERKFRMGMARCVSEAERLEGTALTQQILEPYSASSHVDAAGVGAKTVDVRLEELRPSFYRLGQTISIFSPQPKRHLHEYTCWFDENFMNVIVDQGRETEIR